MIWLLPEPTEEDIKEINKARQPKMGDKPFGTLYIERIVTTPNELKEKLLIFDSGLDDRILELYKVIFLSQLDKFTGDESVKDEEVREILFDNASGEHGCLVIFFASKEPIIAPLDYKLYLKIFDDFIEFVGKKTKTGFQFVDYQWTINILKEKAKDTK